jgi:hypothetical protein
MWKYGAKLTVMVGSALFIGFLSAALISGLIIIGSDLIFSTAAIDKYLEPLAYLLTVITGPFYVGMLFKDPPLAPGQHSDKPS